MIHRKVLCAAALLSSLCLPAAAGEVQKSEPSLLSPAYDMNAIPGKMIPEAEARSIGMASPWKESEPLAQLRRPAGIASGPAYGTNVIPSTALQKTVLQKEVSEGRSVSSSSTLSKADMLGALAAAGGPGIEGLPNTQSGR